MAGSNNHRGFRSFAIALAAMSCALLGAACGSDDEPSSGGDAKPVEVKTDWGTFRLNERIADKVAAGEPINYVFSYAGAGTPLFSDQYNLGYKRGLTEGNRIYPLNGEKVAPVQPDANEQRAALQTKLAAGQIDCLAVSPGSPTAFNSFIDRIVDDGIPVFTVGVPTDGRELTNFTQIPQKEGAQAAQTVLDWMDANGKDFTTFAVSTGDPTQAYSVGRIDSFVKTIQQAIPNARFVTDQDNALNMGYDAAGAYSKAKAFLSAHPEIQVLENVDIGAEAADRAIKELGHTGETYTIGWNLTKGQVDEIEAGRQIAIMDQRWPDQAAFGAKACAELVRNGKVLPNTQTLKAYTEDNLSEARRALADIGQ